jgi:hypothetical protein
MMAGHFTRNRREVICHSLGGSPGDMAPFPHDHFNRSLPWSPIVLSLRFHLRKEGKHGVLKPGRQGSNSSPPTYKVSRPMAPRGEGRYCALWRR